MAFLPFVGGIQLHPHEPLLYNHMAICSTAIGTEREREMASPAPFWKVSSCTPTNLFSTTIWQSALQQLEQRERERWLPLPLLEGIRLHPHKSLLYHHMAICFTAIGTGAKFNSNNFFSYKLTITLSSSLHSTQEPQTDNPSNQPISVASHRLSISVGSKTAYTSSVSLLT